MRCMMRGQSELKVITCKGHKRKNASNQVTFDYLMWQRCSSPVTEYFRFTIPNSSIKVTTWTKLDLNGDDYLLTRQNPYFHGTVAFDCMFCYFIGNLGSFLILNSIYFSSGCLWCYCYRWSIHCQVRGYYGSTGKYKMFFAWYTQFILTWGNGGRIVNLRSGKGVAGGVPGACDLHSVIGIF